MAGVTTEIDPEPITLTAAVQMIACFAVTLRDQPLALAVFRDKLHGVFSGPKRTLAQEDIQSLRYLQRVFDQLLVASKQT